MSRDSTLSESVTGNKHYTHRSITGNGQLYGGPSSSAFCLLVLMMQYRGDMPHIECMSARAVSLKIQQRRHGLLRVKGYPDH